MADSEGITKHHALFVTVPFQGHFTPAANFAVKLTTRGFIVTFVTTEAFHNQRAASGAVSVDGHEVFADARSMGMDIRSELVTDGLPLMRKLQFAEPPIDVLISDTFNVWPSTLAKKFGLPYVSFWTEPALVFAMYYYMHLLVENGHLGSPTETRKDTIMYIPGVPSIEPTDLVSFFHSPEASWRVLRNVGKAFEEAKGADFVLCNTVQELEAEVIGALQQERPFYAVGPIVPASGEGGAATSLWPELDCSQWLHSMPPRSVLYISFGSIARKQVLLHPAVGGFLTHCGWNSILESMWCGVPMLCFPVTADQPTNRKLVVEDLRIGIDVGSIGEVTGADVSRRIDSLMGGEVGGALRKEMEGAQKAVKSAVTPTGSSSKNLEQFTADLLKHLSDKKRER
ncbi:UDP-glucoronosyl and UDP-glucosyl transferase [Musa troglodytarum]|uniref:UDP-glucoronosyl and UDP-glucosyl transferase n=1 Tax=Musa troglodytarum TaxID=320322 RepID=A0A9E7FSW7_9LILI|nr:UDP-glucoronosyl and UDP-glucosyl transferase [Musa troglodytarum]